LKAIVRSTGLLGASTGVTVVCGLASAKLWAIWVGPHGLGYMALLQSLLGITSLVVGLGVTAGLVRFGSEPAARADGEALAALQRAAWLLTALAACFAVLVLLLFRGPVGQLALGRMASSTAVPLVAVACVFGLISGVQTGILNAHHKVAALAKFAGLAAIFGTLVEVPFIYIWRSSGVPYAIVATSVVTCGISVLLVRLELPRSPAGATSGEVRRQVGALLRFGLPYTASMLVGTGVLFLMPVLVLHIVGPPSVGYYRAAAVIGSTYIGFLLSSMAQDYFPRVSAAAGRPPELARLVNDQQKLVLLLGVPTILAALALAPVAVPILYSGRFGAATGVLEWQVAGDVFRLSSWTLSFVVLARCGSKTFFATEVIGGASILFGSIIGMVRFGLPGAGMGYLVGYAVYYLATWLFVRISASVRLGRSNAVLLASAVVAIGVARAASLILGPGISMIVTLALAGGFFVYSATIISPGMGGIFTRLASPRRLSAGPSQ